MLVGQSDNDADDFMDNNLLECLHPTGTTGYSAEYEDRGASDVDARTSTTFFKEVVELTASTSSQDAEPPRPSRMLTVDFGAGMHHTRPRHVRPQACAPPIYAPQEHAKLLTPDGMGEWMDGTSQTPMVPARACVLRMCASAMPTSFHTLPVAKTVDTS
jgi:hypothetical protein